MNVIARTLAVVVLLLANAFFVAAEFALVRSRRMRLEAMVRAGDGKARLALRAIGTIRRMLSASQLGITISSLGLGWMAERTVGVLMRDAFAALPAGVEVPIRVAIGSIVALLIITYVLSLFFSLHTHKHLYVGEAGPHTDELVPTSSTGKSVGLLLAATAGEAVMSELLVGAVDETARGVGLVLVPILRAWETFTIGANSPGSLTPETSNKSPRRYGAKRPLLASRYKPPVSSAIMMARVRGSDSASITPFNCTGNALAASLEVSWRTWATLVRTRGVAGVSS